MLQFSLISSRKQNIYTEKLLTNIAQKLHKQLSHDYNTWWKMAATDDGHIQITKPVSL